MRPTPYPTPAHLRNQAAERQLQKMLKEEFGNNQVDVYALEARELAGVWVTLQKKNGESDKQTAEKFREITTVILEAVIGHTSDATSALVLAKLGADMQRSGNILGTYRVVQRNGRKLIIFRGWAGLRRTLNAPVYGLTNPTVIKMGVGQAAAKAMLRSGLALTIVVSPTIRTLEWLFIDEKATLETVLAKVSTDILKGAITAGASYFAAASVATFAGGAVVAVLPLAGAIGAALIVGYGLGMIDNRLGITDKLITALAREHGRWKQTSGQISRDVNYYFGTPQGQMEFIRNIMR